SAVAAMSPSDTRSREQPRRHCRTWWLLLPGRMRRPSWWMGSSPASLDRWPADGSMTSDVPKKSRTRGQAAGILVDRLRGWDKNQARQRVRRARRLRIPEPAPGVLRDCSAGLGKPLGAADE